jgi:hypothetical protein
MKRHNSETNFNFIRSLNSSKGLGNVKLDFHNSNEKSECKLLKAIWFKKYAEINPIATKKRILLTEYKNTIITTKIKVK